MRIKGEAVFGLFSEKQLKNSLQESNLRLFITLKYR